MHLVGAGDSAGPPEKLHQNAPIHARDGRTQSILPSLAKQRTRSRGWYDQWPDSSEMDTASGTGRVLHGAACDPSSGTRTIVAHPLRKSNAKSINICGISCRFASGSTARRGMHHRRESGFFIFLSMWSAAARSASDTAQAARTAYRVSGRSWPAARMRQNSPQGRPARVRDRCY